LEEKRAYAAKEAEKLALAAQKAEQRAAQRAQQVSEKNSKQNTMGGPTTTIQQPDKNKKTK